MVDVVDIMNQGLRASGLPLRIEDYYDGSDASKVALEVYGQARDELIRSQDWSFARRTVALTLLKGPPPAGGYSYATPWSNIYPFPGYLYEYSYPSDCLSLRAIMQQPGQMPDSDPLPALFRIDNDQTPVVTGTPPTATAAGPAAKVILCDTTNAIGVYWAQVTDPNEWEPGFTATLVASLGKKFAVAFGADTNTSKEQSAEAVGVAQVAGAMRG